MSSSSFDFWMFLSGLGIFLFGMYHLEKGLQGFARNSLKRLLQKFTDRPLKAILTGTFVTAILQSSSLVTLMVLAFLGTKLMTLKNSLGVILGANLGTTATAWIVVTLGFKVSISKLSFPFLAIGILSYLFMKKRPFIRSLGSFLMGFGLLFLGLDYMKLSVEGLTGNIDIQKYSMLGLWVFVLIGIVITALIQSSSAVIVIVLSALNANIIDVYQAFSIVIGANIGTTSTGLIASIGGSIDKKRLATANLIFNVVTGIVNLVVIRWSIVLVSGLISSEDPLILLIIMNTILNLSGIVLFYPFIDHFEKLIRGFYSSLEKKEEDTVSRLVQNVSSETVGFFISEIKEDLNRAFELAISFIYDCFQPITENRQRLGILSNILKVKENPYDKYDRLKKLEEEITQFYIKLQEDNLSNEDADRINGYMYSLRSIVYAAKHIKDINRDIRLINESEDLLAKEILNHLREFVKTECERLRAYFIQTNVRETVLEIFSEYEQRYKKIIENLYEGLKREQKREVPVSAITNIIRRTVSACEELVNAISNKD